MGSWRCWEIGSRQSIAGPGNQLKKRVRRNRLEYIFQALDASFYKVRQGEGRIQQAEQDMGVGSPHIQISQHDALALFGQQHGQVGRHDTLPYAAFS